MKLILILTCSFLINVTASVYSQNTHFTFSVEGKTIKDVFRMIEKESQFRFLYNDDFTDLNQRVSIDAKNYQVEDILDKLLNKSGITYRVMENNLIVITPVEYTQQGITVTGTVTDERGDPMPGVNVVIKETSTGVITDAYGKYSITVPGKDAVLLFSFIGFTRQEVQIGDRKQINLVLEEDSKLIEEVVVTAMGIEKNKRSLSYTTEQVKMDPLTTVRDPSLATSLSGRLAGVNVSNSAGATGVGGSSRIVIRGNRSVGSNNQPLIVVDGVPYSNAKGMLSTSQSTLIVDSFDGFSNINADDVESINVLKGPAAAALYGSEANNGVLIVTTKKARIGAPKVEFNSIATVDIPYMYPHLQNEYARGTGGIFSPTMEASSWGPKMTGQIVTDWNGKEQALTPQPDNVKDFFANGYNFTNSLSYSTGAEKSTAYFSYANTTARGMLVTDKLQRNNFNLRLTAELLPKLKMDFKITYFDQKMANRPAAGDNYFSPMQSLLRMPRSMRSEDIKEYEYYTNEGSLKQNFWVPEGSTSQANPYWVMNRRIAPTSRTRVTAFSSLKYDITDWLWVQARVSLDKINDDAEEKIYCDAQYVNNGNGNYFTSFSNRQNFTGDFMLNFHKELNNGLSLNAMFGSELKDYRGRGQSAETNGLSVENKFALSYGLSNTTTDREFRTQIQSLFGTAQIAFRNMLFLDLTARNDWNSTLPPPYDYFYPSVGLTGVISDMVQLPEVISFAKFRVSYAEVGNGAGFASIFQTYGRSTAGPIGQITTQSTKVAEQLVPERSKSWEAGGELRMWHNRLGIDFTWYKSNTINQLISITSPSTAGYSRTEVNCGNIQNKGIELMVSANPVNHTDFTWNMYWNFSRNVNEVKELHKNIDRYQLSSANLALGQSWVIVGRPYGEQYGKSFMRDDLGNIIVSNTTGIPLTTENPDYYLGNFNYDWQTGLSNTFRYKNWNLSFLIDLNYGGVRQSATEARLMGGGGSPATLFGRDGFIFAGVKQDGTPNDISITAQQYGQAVGGRGTSDIPIDLYNHDATNSRLRELTIGYLFSFKTGSIVKSLRISAVGRNLFYFYNGCDWFDPDVTYDSDANGQGGENCFLPGTRTLGVNIKLSL